MFKNLRTIILVITLISLTACVIMLEPISAVSKDNWVKKTSMPTARYDLRAAVVDGKIYAIGGFPAISMADYYNGSKYVGFNEEYDPATDTWTSKSAMPAPLLAFGIAVYQNKIYCIDGTTIEVYNPANDTWEIKAPMPNPRSQFEANVVNGKICVIGGRTGGKYSTVTLNEVYDPATGEWTTKAPMPYPVVQYASAVIGNKIYVMGGQNEFKINNTMTIYDTETDTWSLGSSLPTAVWKSAAGVLAPERIYVVGGQPDMSGESTNAVQIYNPVDDNWSIGASMLSARFGLGVAVLNDKLYAIGGTNRYLLPGERAMTENEVYTPMGYEPESSTPDPKTPDSLPMELLVVGISLVIISVVLLSVAKAKKTRNNQNRLTLPKI
jgi:N-acetylneuraminic acid mutarotase